ncbi:Salicylic acid-binding protein 2 [Fagus crenata]
MSGASSNCSRLCRLINDSLHQYTVNHTTLSHSTSQAFISDQNFFNFLLLKQIQLWTPKLNAYSHNGKEIESASKSECSHSQPEDHHCLAKIVAHLIVLLTLESQYVQHLAGNVFGFISEFVATSKSDWDGFINLLCVCLELAITNALSDPSAPSSSEAEDCNSDSLKFEDVIKPRLKNANWCTVAGIIRVLRNILKYLKREDDDQLLEVYLNCVDSCLSNVHWDLFDEVHVGQNGGTQKRFCADALFLRNISGLQEPSIIFLGNFLQLLCSLVYESNFLEAAGGCIDKHPICNKIINFVPKVLNWCLSKEGEYVDTCISQYFRHKLLLHYDHQVLLDYLISKDMGISCAEYLLRCLRIIFDSWCLFVEFSFDGKVINQSSCKKRKVSLDGSNFEAYVTPMLVENNGIITSQEKEYNRGRRYGSKHHITQPFEEAKECLLSLRNSVESLHKKNLFPYNPKVLLKRWVP